MTNYYLAANGDDSNAGAKDAPWATIGHVNSAALVAGDGVYFNRGDLWRQDVGLTVPVSGLSYGAWGAGARPALNVARIVTGWQLVAGDVYAAPWITDSNRIVTYTNESGTVHLHGNDGAKENVALNEWDFDLNSATMYINVGGDPSDGVVEVARTGACIQGDGVDDVTVKDISLSHSNLAGLYIKNASRWTVENVASSWSYFGSYLEGFVRDSTLSSCDIRRNTNDGIYLVNNSKNNVIDGCTVEHNGLGLQGDRDGIGIGGNPAENAGNVIKDCIIRHNHSLAVAIWRSGYCTVEDCIIESDAPASAAIGASRSNNVTVKDNVIRAAWTGIGYNHGDYMFPTVTGNVIRGAAKAGVFLDATNMLVDGQVNDNVAIDCDVGFYMHHGLSTGLHMNGNRAIGCREDMRT